MNIAIIGAGNVGGTLCQRLKERGHQITYGTAHPDASKGETTVEQAAQNAETVVLAIPFSAVDEVIAQIGENKIVIDCTNPIKSDFSGIEEPSEGSAAQHIASKTKNKVVKAFNTIGFNIMANPKFPNGNATLLYAGDDDQAKKQVHQLASSIGFNPVDAGPLTQARYLEHFAWLWISLAMKYGQGREIVFQLEKR